MPGCPSSGISVSFRIQRLILPRQSFLEQRFDRPDTLVVGHEPQGIVPGKKSVPHLKLRFSPPPHRASDPRRHVQNQLVVLLRRQGAQLANPPSSRILPPPGSSTRPATAKARPFGNSIARFFIGSVGRKATYSGRMTITPGPVEKPLTKYPRKTLTAPGSGGAAASAIRPLVSKEYDQDLLCAALRRPFHDAAIVTPQAITASIPSPAENHQAQRAWVIHFAAVSPAINSRAFPSSNPRRS